MKRLFSLGGWIFALALLSVGLHNFDLGISMDGPLYATIARNLAQTEGASWWRLLTTLPEFQPYFAEHPHLGFWTSAALLKVLPAADWAARLPSQLFYMLTLGLMCAWVSRLAHSKRAGVLTVILIWLFPIVSNFFSNAYLDPQAFFFGLLALFAFERGTSDAARGRLAWAVLSGLALLGVALTKGFTVLGFGPAMAFMVLARLRAQPRPLLVAATVCLSVFACGLALYAWALAHSPVPDFLATYFERQWSGRFAVATDWHRLLRWHFYKELARETHYLLLLLPLALVWRRRSTPAGLVSWLPIVVLVSFVLMYVPADRVGHQYWIMLLPWAAWWLALALDALLPASWTEFRLRQVTFAISVVLVIFLKVSSFQVYKPRVPPLALEIQSAWRNKPLPHTVWIEARDGKDPFIRSSLWAWYTGLSVDYVSQGELRSGARSIPKGDVFVLETHGLGPERDAVISDLKQQGLCVGESNKQAVYWVHCF
jgi:4-amino-4-deoxy-L-arabinose transferase-like glycosyltransferase